MTVIMDIQLHSAPSIDLSVNDADQPFLKREYVVIPDGHVQSKSGDFDFDPAQAESVIGEFREQGVDLPVDYEHQTVGEEFSSPDGKAPAAGWIKSLRYVAGRGLMALIRWTDQAAEFIRSGAYRYMSPVLLVDKTTRNVQALHSVGLTNVPAIAGFPEITPFKGHHPTHRRITMADQPGTGDTTGNTPADGTGQSVDTLIVSLRELLSLPEDTSPEDVLAATIEALRSASASADAVASSAKLLGLDDADGQSLIAAINSLKAGTVPKDQWVEVNSRLQTLEQTNQSLRVNAMKMEIDTLINRYVAEGKLNAAMAEFHRTRLGSDVDRFEVNKADFEKLMDAQPVIVPQGQTAGTGTAGGGDDRDTIINKAATEYDTAGSTLQGMTSRAAFVNDKLRQANRKRLTKEERETLTA